MNRPAIALGLSALAAAAPFARAALVLDAHYAPATTAFVSAVTAPPSYGIEDAAQTFAVENTGALKQLDLQLERGAGAGFPTGNLHWDIRPLTSGAPNPDPASALVSGDIPAADVNADAPNKTYISLTNLSLNVTAGQQLAIVLHNAGTNYFGWGADNAGPAGPYPGGAYFDRQDPATAFTQFPSFDQAFRTFVDAVPEPTSLSLLALATIPLARRRRSSRR